MILTRTHALYFAARRLPPALRQYAQDVTIDQVVNAHAPKKKAGDATEPHNTMALLRLKGKRCPAEVVEFVLERGAGRSDDWRHTDWPDRREAYCRKWAKKILKGRKA